MIVQQAMMVAFIPDDGRVYSSGQVRTFLCLSVTTGNPALDWAL
jgi:hypothetical protein